jgi:hypothetical protein
MNTQQKVQLSMMINAAPKLRYIAILLQVNIQDAENCYVVHT